MRRSIALFAVLFLALSLTLPAVAAPFGDVPEDHWAAEAVSQLAAKGLVEGYPDGLYRGDRAASRYEMAMVVSRLLAKVEQMAKHGHPDLASKKDLDLIKKLLNEFRDELDALGVRVTNAEDALASLEKRVTELERVKVYGEFRTRWIAQNIDARVDQNAAGATVLPTAAQLESFVDNQNLHGRSGAGNPFNYGRVYNTPPNKDGTTLTTSATIGVTGKLAKGIDGGAEISAWSATGDRNLAFNTGTRLPYLSNPFTENATFGPTGTLRDNAFNMRASLDNLWIKKGDWKLTMGTFTPQRVKRYFLGGAPNLQFVEPGDFYPLWGGQLAGKWMAGDHPMWGEAWIAKLPEFGGSSGAVNTYTFGAHVDLNFNDNKGNVGVNWQRVQNSDLRTGGAQATINRPLGGATAFGGAHTPWTYNGVAVNAGGTAVLPSNQEQDMFGIDFTHKFPEANSKYLKDLMFEAKWAHSDYKPTTVSAVIAGVSTQAPSRTGDMWAILLGAKAFNVDWKAEWLSVDATYDPFLIQLPNPFGLFTGPGTGYTTAAQSPFSVAFAPGGGLTSGFYSPHHSRDYPHNREGWRATGSWDFVLFKNNANLYSAIEQFYQKDPSNATNMAGVGFTEPSFTLAATSLGTNTIGRLQTWHNGFRYDISLPWTKNKLTWYTYHRLRHHRRNITPGTAGELGVNNTTFDQHRWATRFSYPFSKKLSVFAGYALEERNQAANSATVTQKWSQQSWVIGAFYNVTDKADWYIQWQHFNKQKYANPLVAGTTTLLESGLLNPYSGDTVMSGFNMKF